MKESKQGTGKNDGESSIKSNNLNIDSEELGPDSIGSAKSGKVKLSSSKKSTSKKSKKKNKGNGSEVNLDEYKVGAFTYKIPGKRQRVIVASLVLGLNLILALGVALYFYNPGFKDFIYNLGR